MTSRIYADYAASAPMRSEALEAYISASSSMNPAGQYATGRTARKLLEESREQVAHLLGAEPIEVIFTGSGTEADNIALSGLAHSARRIKGADTILHTQLEHPAVLETIKWLSQEGFHTEIMPSTPQGRIDLDALSSAGYDPADYGVATLMWANNETGAIQPEREFLDALPGEISTHVDAVQAMGHLPIDFHSLGATTLVGSAHKFGGPKGLGILLARRDATLDSPIRGGGQEREIRPGTVDVAAIVATAAALSSATAEIETEQHRVAGLRDQLADVVSTIPDAHIHTTEPALPGHLHITFPGAEGDSLIMLLDSLGVDASTGSACAAGVNRASHVLAAMDIDTLEARGALRLTLGKDTTQDDIDRVKAILPGVVQQARDAGMAY